MKCDNWIDPTKTGKRGQLLKSALVAWYDASETALALVKRDAKIERCGGNIVATVEIIDEPYMGGTSGSLEIKYQCDRCKEILYGPDLPRESEQLSAILTEHIARRPQRGGGSRLGLSLKRRNNKGE